MKASLPLTLSHVPSKQVKYKEKFDKEVKGKRPQYDLKESKIYKTLKDANVLASEVGAQHLGISQHHCFEQQPVIDFQ